MKFKLDEHGNLELLTDKADELVALGQLKEIIKGAQVHQQRHISDHAYLLECRFNEVVNALLKK
jgi:hypothetical protein